jgi:hypothetical protein
VALNARARAEFVNTYTRLLITAWSSEEFSQQLATDPRAALAEAGLEIPAGGEVVLVRTIPDAKHGGNLDLQVALWEKGLASGRYELHIPETPQLDTVELDEDDLSGVGSGGFACCCCPCSCCT